MSSAPANSKSSCTKKTFAEKQSKAYLEKHRTLNRYAKHYKGALSKESRDMAYYIKDLDRLKNASLLRSKASAAGLAPVRADAAAWQFGIHGGGSYLSTGVATKIQGGIQELTSADLKKVDDEVLACRMFELFQVSCETYKAAQSIYAASNLRGALSQGSDWLCDHPAAACYTSEETSLEGEEAGF